MDFDDHTQFPENFPDVGNREFIDVFHEKKEFVEFTLTWTNTRGFFRVWFEYCVRKSNGVE